MSAAASAGWDTAEFRCSCGDKFTARTPAEFNRLLSEHKAVCTYRPTNPLLHRPNTASFTREAQA